MSTGSQNTVPAVGTGLKNGIDWLPWLVGGLTILVLFTFLIMPIGNTLLLSFVKKGAELSFANLTLGNFERFIDQPLYRSAFWHSLVVASATTAVATAVALPAAFAVTRVAMPFRNVILALSVIPIISPPFVGAYSWVMLLGRSGIITHYVESWFGIQMPSVYGPFGIVLALSLHYFPFIFMIVQGALAAADPYIEESAGVMGASRLRILGTITFPLVLPAVAAGAIIVFVKALGNFGVPAILGGNYFVLPTLIYFQVHGYFDLNSASAISLVNVILTIIALAALARVNRKGQFVTVTGGSRRSRQLTSTGAKLFGNVYVWMLLAVALLPQAVVIFSSFAEEWAATLFPVKYGFGNYAYVLSDVTAPIMNSILLAGGATIMCAVFGTLTAYTVVRKKFKGKWALDMTIMLPFVLPAVVTAVAFLTTFNDGPLVLTGTATILIMAYFIRRLAYMFRTVTAALAQVDSKMEEASMICGATWGATMRKVTMPLVVPGVLAGTILVFTTLLTDMNVTILLYSARWRTIAVAIFERLTGEEYLAASTIGSIAIIMILIMVFAASKLVGKSMAEMFR
jgi:iron(III) transport system permease protein